MKTKIKYESFKRAKEIISVKKSYEKYTKFIFSAGKSAPGVDR